MRDQVHTGSGTKRQPTPQRPTAGTGLIDLDRYPLHDGASPAYAELLRSCRAQIADNGCVVLPGFVRPATVRRMKRDTEALSSRAHFNDTYTNPYNSSDDPALPESHPKRMFQDRTNAFVAGDLIDEDTCIRHLYHDPALQGFLADMLDVEQIHEYADPLAGLVVNVLKPGCQHPWHFDTNEFVVSLLTRQASDGGLFEYCPGIRNPEDENFEAVGDVIRGDRAPVHTLDLRPGDLQIFFGRYSLHRVTRVQGDDERHTLILGYARQPDLVGRAERTQKLFGRVADVHRRQSENLPARGDKLAD